jgi:hypothetical protein
MTIRERTFDPLAFALSAIENVGGTRADREEVA